jgi:hypothetical protein
MTGNAQKTPLVATLNRFAEAKAADAAQVEPKQLPCSVVTVVSSGVVTVKFEVQAADALGATLPNVTVPVAWPEYVRYPVQPGDKGFCLSADAFLGGVSGLGGGVASLVRQGNLATLAFQPVGSTAWTRTTNADAVVIYGVAGGGVALYSDIAGQAVSLVLTKNGITITGNVTLNGNLMIAGAVTATGNVTAGQGGAASVELLQHRHLSSGGTGTGGPPQPGS